MISLIKKITNFFFHRFSSFSKSLKLLINGTHLRSIGSLDLQGDLEVGMNVQIGRQVTFQGIVKLSDGVIIFDNCLLKDCVVGPNTEIRSSSIIEDSVVSSDSFIGPFARLRSNTLLGQEAQIGNFVEIKNSSIGDKCRINHMAFIGDASIGSNVTIGAGTITCNHDGVEINKTTIEDGAYIGSNVNLVAPITIYSNATIGSGSTITQDAPEEKLTLARMKQTTIESWKGPKSTRR